MAATRPACVPGGARSGPETRAPTRERPRAAGAGRPLRPPTTAASGLRGTEDARERCPREHVGPDVVQVEVDLPEEPDAALPGLVDRIERVAVDRYQDRKSTRLNS